VTTEQVQDERITAFGLFSEALTGLTGRLAAQLADNGLTTVEFEVLIRLARSPRNELRMTDLSAQTSLTTSGITRVVDRLTRDGLVCRRSCPTDRRSAYAVLTEGGTARLDAVLPGHLAMIDHWFTGLLEPDRLADFIQSLRIIRDTVRPAALAGVPVPGQPAPAEAPASRP
jgi:DNA-binding MarR family transcriptional regulator